MRSPWSCALLPLLLASACSAEVADLRPSLAQDAGLVAPQDAGIAAPQDAGTVVAVDAGGDVVDYPTMCPELATSPIAREAPGARSVDVAPSGDRALIVGAGVVTVVALPSGEVVATGPGRSSVLVRSGRARVVLHEDQRLERVDEDGATIAITRDAPCTAEVSPDRRYVFSVVACRDAPSVIGTVGRLERFDLEDATTTIVDEDVIAGSLRGTPAGIDPPRVAYLRGAVEAACGPADPLRSAEAVEQTVAGPRRAPPAPRRYSTLEGYTAGGVLLGTEAECASGERVWDVAGDRLVGEGRLYPRQGTVSALDIPLMSAAWRPAAALGARGVVLASGTVPHLTMTYRPIDAAAAPQVLVTDSRSPTGTVLRADGADVAAIVATDRLVRVGLAPESPALTVLASGLGEVTVSEDGAQAAFDASLASDTITLVLGGARAPFTAVRTLPRTSRLSVLGFAPASGALLLHDRDGLHAVIGGRTVDLDVATTERPSALAADARGCWIAWAAWSTDRDVVRIVPAPRG